MSAATWYKSFWVRFISKRGHSSFFAGSRRRSCDHSGAKKKNVPFLTCGKGRNKVMQRKLLFTPATWLLAPTALFAADKKIKILLIGKDLDHARNTHPYLSDCELLA